MSATLYLLRQQPDRISSSLFRVDDPDMEIIFLERAAMIVPPSMKGAMVTVEGIDVDPLRPRLTYDDLVEKIFSSDRIVVL